MMWKRRFFALLSVVFAMCGCTFANDQNSSDFTMYKEEKIPQFFSHTLMDQTLKDELLAAYDIAHAKENYIIRDFRMFNGEWRMKKAMEKKSASILAGVNAKIEEEQKRDRFTLTITTYGVDCVGCGGEDGRGNTALGVMLDLHQGVMMPNGSWQQGIQYGSYYIIAAGPQIPLCSIMKISHHGLEGSGIMPDVPYYAIVLDRGGAIYGTHIDLYTGSEANPLVKPVEKGEPFAEMIRYGGQVGNTCLL